jgi:hypothetical protein
VDDIQEEEVVESVGDEDRLLVGEESERSGKRGEVALTEAAVKEDNDDKEAVVVIDEET